MNMSSTSESIQPPDVAIWPAKAWRARLELWCMWLFRMEVLLIVGPLFLASLARPLGLWDYLTASRIYLPYGAFSVSSLYHNLIHNIFAPTLTVRPTYALIVNFLYLIFGGEFWLWYLLKWIAKFSCAYWIDQILDGCHCNRISRLVAVSVFLFHPADFELMLYAPDGLVALFGLLTICVLSRSGRQWDFHFDITRPSRLRLLGVYGLWFCALGMKEVGFVFALALLGVVHLGSPRNSKFIVRVAPFYMVVVFWIWKLLVASRNFPSSNVESGQGMRFHPEVLLRHLQFLTPSSPFRVIAIIFIVLLGISLWLIAKSADRKLRLLSLFLWTWAVGSLLFVSMTLNGATRYIQPSLVAWSLTLGLGAAVAGKRFYMGHAGLAGFALMFPLLTGGDLYRQALSFQESFYEAADVIHVVQAKLEEGYQFCLTGEDEDIPMENQGTLRFFFEQYGAQFYGQKTYSVNAAVARDGLPTGKAVLVTRYGPMALLSSGIRGTASCAMERVYQIRRGGYGLLEKMAHHFPFPGATTTYDFGSPVETLDSQYYIYLLSSPCTSRQSTAPRAQENIRDIDIEFMNLTRKIEQRGKLPLDSPYTFRSGKGEIIKLQVPLQSTVGHVQVLYSGQCQVKQGTVVFGISDEGGHDLWNTILPSDGQWHKCPAAPAVSFEPQHRYYLFWFAMDPGGVEGAVNGLQFQHSLAVERVPGARRFGAMGW